MPQKKVLITTREVHKSFGGERPIIVPSGEEAKSLKWAEQCWHEMLKRGCDRQTVVIGMGGGSVCDLAGFVAACYMRGVDLVLIPTTLLAMVDAAIGGKNGVNMGAKNMIGTLYQPKEVIIDPKYLKTLPPKEWKSGMAEVIKYGVIADAKLFEGLEKDLNVPIERCIEIKREIIKDGRRDILNWGHTVGHAVETLTGLSHGEAVAIGMHAAALLSRLMGKGDIVDRQYALLKKVGLPTEIPKGIDRQKLMEMMRRDKKGAGTFVIAEDIGRVDLAYNVNPSLVLKAIS